MEKTSLSDLRSHMFDVIERLKSLKDPNCDENEKIDVETARAISEAGKVIIDSAKVEIDALRIIANSETDLSWYKNSKSGILQLPEGSSKV